MFFTRNKPPINNYIGDLPDPHPPIVHKLSNQKTSLDKTKREINQNMQFGMISRIQGKTFCFSCGK